MNNNQVVREQEETSTRGRAHLVGIPYLDSRKLTDFKPVNSVFTIEQMYQRKMVPLAKSRGQIDVAITINTSQALMNEVRKELADFNIKYFVISDSGYKDLMVIYNPPKEVKYDDISIKQGTNIENLLKVSEALNQVRSDDIVAYLVKQALILNASDIHLEAQKRHIRMRFRIDGTLHPVAVFSHAKYRQIQSSIAIKAGISNAAPDAQTGHMAETVEIDGKAKTINMRIETVPTMFGQDAVLRLFSMDQSLLELENIGLSDEELQVINQIITHPHGMVLVVGPTGSGKTTTLYSMLNKLNTPSRKIITLEDPVEYGFDGISQIQVDSRLGDSFSEKLRAVLRQDPDVIMLGEIRDADTARTSLQASLTGHLVLSTFHADNAAAALTRLFDTIGGNPMFSSAIRLVIAQRLVRKLDDTTKVPYQPDEATKDQLKQAFANLPASVGRPDIDNLTLYKAGKSEDNPFGYKGRIIVMEQLIISKAIQDIVHDDKRRSQDNIENQAYNDGMLSMKQDALLKAVSGLTTLEEVYRVVD